MSAVRIGMVVLAMVVWGRLIAAQEIEIPRVEGEVVVDGDPSEDLWRHATHLPMTMFEPSFGARIDRASTVLIAHDGEFLYAAGIFEDDGPVTANSLVRDYYADDDLFNLVIDSFDDDETALWFLVTPAGTRVDGAITDDAEGERWNHEEFDNLWDAAATTTAQGWTAEMRIPLASLRIQARDDVARLGLIAGRLIVRARERHTFPPIRPGPAVAQFKPSLAAPVVLRGVSSGRPVEVRPYLTGGWRRASTPAESETVHELGADARMTLGSHSTLNLTVNTDFAQTEADDERLNLTRFSLVFPEKRQFFLEQSGTFDVGDGEDHRVFYSRRIGLSEAGLPERIYGGARITGRTGAWEFGALSLQTSANEGSTNNAVVRARRRVLNPLSRIGGITTTVIDESGRASGAAALDGDINVVGTQFVSFTGATSWAGTTDAGVSMRLRSEKRDRTGLGHRLDVHHVTENYHPPLGFVERTGVFAAGGEVRYGMFSGSGRFQERVVAVDGRAVRRNGDGRLETGTVGVSLHATRRGGGTGSAEIRVRREDVTEPFSVGEAGIPAGRYRFTEAALSLTLPAGWSRRGSLAVSGGEYFDGHRLSVALNPVWTPSRYVQLEADLETSWIDFSERRQHYRADIARLRVRLARDAHLSLYGLLQYNGAVDRAAANVRLRYNFREGRDFYVVWTEGWMEEGTPAASWVVSQRRIQFKYTHTTWW